LHILIDPENLNFAITNLRLILYSVQVFSQCGGQGASAPFLVKTVLPYC